MPFVIEELLWSKFNRPCSLRKSIIVIKQHFISVTKQNSLDFYLFTMKGATGRTRYDSKCVKTVSRVSILIDTHPIRSESSQCNLLLAPISVVVCAPCELVLNQCSFYQDYNTVVISSIIKSILHWLSYSEKNEIIVLVYCNYTSVRSYFPLFFRKANLKFLLVNSKS